MEFLSNGNVRKHRRKSRSKHILSRNVLSVFCGPNWPKNWPSWVATSEHYYHHNVADASSWCFLNCSTEFFSALRSLLYANVMRHSLSPGNTFSCSMLNVLCSIFVWCFNCRREDRMEGGEERGGRRGERRGGKTGRKERGETGRTPGCDTTCSVRFRNTICSKVAQIFVWANLCKISWSFNSESIQFVEIYSWVIRKIMYVY